MVQIALGQVKVDQQSVGSQVIWLYPTTTGMQEAELWILRQRDAASTQVGVSVTHTGSRTGEVAKLLIV